MSEMIAEKLLEQRDFYLNTLKHLEFELMTNPTEKDLDRIKTFQMKTVDQLKRVEQELAFLSNNDQS